MVCGELMTAVIDVQASTQAQLSSSFIPGFLFRFSLDDFARAGTSVHLGSRAPGFRVRDVCCVVVGWGHLIVVI